MLHAEVLLNSKGEGAGARPFAGAATAGVLGPGPGLHPRDGIHRLYAASWCAACGRMKVLGSAGVRRSTPSRYRWCGAGLAQRRYSERAQFRQSTAEVGRRLTDRVQ